MAYTFISSCIKKEAVDSFLDAVATYDYGRSHFSDRSSTIDELIQVVTSKDHTAPLIPTQMPSTIIQSPFEGNTVEEIADWVKEDGKRRNTTSSLRTFIILDAQTMKDGFSCIVASLPNQYEPVMAMRCDFQRAVVQAWNFGTFYHFVSSFDGDSHGLFIRSRLVMTKKNYETQLSFNEEDGVWKLNEWGMELGEAVYSEYDVEEYL